MSWRSITDITEGTSSFDSAKIAVDQLDAQLTALETFLADTEELAASDPNLAKMRDDVQALYDGTTAALDQISVEDLEGAGSFYAVGALSQISTGIKLTISIPDPKEGGGTVANFYRSADFHNSEDALAIEDEGERAAFVEARRESWANSENLENYLESAEVSNAFALATIDAARAQNDPSYTPNPERSFDGIADINDQGPYMMRINVGGDTVTDPIDVEANMLYRTMDAYRWSDVEENPGALMSPEMKEYVQETNLNVMARALNGEYGNEIRIMGEIENRSNNDRVNIEDIDPRIAVRSLANRTGTTFNPFHGFGAIDVQGGVKPDFSLPEDDHIGEFIMGDFRQERDEFPERLDRISDLVDAADGQRIPIEEIYTAMDKDPAGPNFDLPTPRTMQGIERSIGSLEERVSMLEQLVADPKAQNFQDVLQENETSIEHLMLGIKRDMEQTRYTSGLEGETYDSLYADGNFDQRMEALLGVPMDQSQTITYEGSPLLQAVETNFHTFHPADANAAEVPEMRDGSSQLGAALTERGGAIIMDSHAELEPMQFLRDSLPEIASHGSSVILIENAAGFRPEGGLIDLSRNYDPIHNYYETGDASHLDVLKNSLTARMEAIAEQRELTPDEQAMLTELQERDVAFKEMIVDAHENHGIKVEFFGGVSEERLSEEFGIPARAVTTNMSWDEKIRDAGEGYDNVIVFGGGGHFVPGLVGDFGQMGLDESLGYPTFSLANPGNILRDDGDYNLAPTENGRWVPTGDPLAVEQEAVTPEVAPSGPTVVPN